MHYILLWSYSFFSNSSQIFPNSLPTQLHIFSLKQKQIYKKWKSKKKETQQHKRKQNKKSMRTAVYTRKTNKKF